MDLNDSSMKGVHLQRSKYCLHGIYVLSFYSKVNIIFCFSQKKKISIMFCFSDILLTQTHWTVDDRPWFMYWLIFLSDSYSI